MTPGSTSFAPEETNQVYLAGPMRGYPDLNFHAFHQAAIALRARGWMVWNPAENEPKINPDGRVLGLREYMAIDLPAVCRSDAVIVLPGWKQSVGATLEVHVAHTCGIPVLRYASLEAVTPFE